MQVKNFVANSVNVMHIDCIIQVTFDMCTLVETIADLNKKTKRVNKYSFCLDRVFNSSFGVFIAPLAPTGTLQATVASPTSLEREKWRVQLVVICNRTTRWPLHFTHCTFKYCF